MSTPLHGVFNVVFSNVNFVLVISMFMVKKCDFLKVLKIPCPKIRFLVTLRSFFSTYSFFQGRGRYFPVSTFKEEFFNEKKSSLAGLKKSYSIFRKSTDFGHFWLPGSTFKVIFLNLQAKCQKILGQYRGAGCSKHCVKFSAFFLQKGAGGVAVLQVNSLQTPWF